MVKDNVRNPIQIGSTTLILIITFGAMIFFSLVLFAKRQIFRVTLRSRRGPHFAIGHNAPRQLCHEITRRLEHTTKIKYEPKLLSEDDYRLQKEKCTYLYRMKALDSYKQFEDHVKNQEPRLGKVPSQAVRDYVIMVKDSPVTPMKGASTGLCRAFIDAYEHARYGYKTFGEAEYNNYMALLHELMSCLIRHKNFKRRKPGPPHGLSQITLSQKGSTERIGSLQGGVRRSSSTRSKITQQGQVEMEYRGAHKRSADAFSTTSRASSETHEESKL